MSIITKKSAQKFWDQCCEYLNDKTDIELVRKEANIENKTILITMDEFYEHLLKSLKNRQFMPNAIGDLDALKSLLFDFSPKSVNEHYGVRWDQLFEDINKKIRPTSRMKKDVPQNSWVVFTKGALDGAAFLSKFESVEDFKTQVDQFAKSKTFCAGLPLLIKLEVTGFGFPLACDFLKDAGWSQYAKPDVHTKRILKAVGFSDGTDYDTFKAMQLIAAHVGETAFSVDKHIWHIGSGKLKKNRFASKKTRDKFLKSLAKKIELIESN